MLIVPPAVADVATPSAFQSEMLRAQNAVRSGYQVPALVWDESLAAEAADYANTLAQSGEFQHSADVAGKPAEGENLWMGTRKAYGFREMTGSWIEEGANFKRGVFPDVARRGSWHDVGHFTQIIWAGTRAVGCGIAANAEDDVLVCRYFPAGNVVGRDPLERSGVTLAQLENR